MDETATGPLPGLCDYWPNHKAQNKNQRDHNGCRRGAKASEDEERHDKEKTRELFLPPPNLSVCHSIKQCLTPSRLKPLYDSNVFARQQLAVPPPTGPNIWLISVDFVSYVSSPSPSPGPRSGADTQALLTCARNRSPHSSPAFQLPRLFTPRKPSCFKWGELRHTHHSAWELP